MSDADEKLRLNTLHRLAKHSDRLVLMEYSHCEVPAGCGGYVMRWRDPSAGRPLVLNVACSGRVQGFIDGAPITSSRCTLTVGQHQLAMHVSVEEAPAPLVVAVFVDDPRAAHDEEEVVLLSADDSTWRCTERAPAADDDWKALDHDDAGWQPLRAWTPTPEELGEDHWRYDWLLNRGAAALRLERGELWIRRRIGVQGEGPG
jgi:hypothetical protein